MSTCPNCGKKLSCGCQKVKASDGRICCNNCVGSYNKNLRINAKSNAKRVILSATVEKRIIDAIDSL